MPQANNQERRNIRIFISSTFKDMARERDYLMKNVFPKLQKIASERNVSVVPLDLRWGITREESKSGKVLEVCLREIEDSRPFFIGILGSRYGWCPSVEELRKNPYLLEEYGDWLTDDIGEELSVTEIEIQYGVLRRQARQLAYFYERRSLFPDARVKRLKERIVKDGRYPLKPFDKPQELGAMIEKDFLALLDSMYPQKELSQQESERIAQKAFRDSLCESYFPHPGMFERLDSFLKGDSKEMVFFGESGMGKSALVANWLKTLPAEWTVVFHSVGQTGKTDWKSVASAISGQLTGNPETKVEDSLRSAAASGKLLLVLDGVNGLSEEEQAKRLRWLGLPPKGAKYLFTTTDGDDTLDTLRLRQADEFRLLPMDPDSRRRMMEQYLARFGKRLTGEQTSRIAHSSIAANTNVLRALLDELLSFGIFEKLDQRIDYYLSSESPKDFFVRMIRRMEEDFGRKAVEPALSLIAFSVKGVSEPEILAISGLPQLALSQLLCSFRGHLMIRGGLMSFRHNHFNEAVRSVYAKRETETRKEIIKHFAPSPLSSRALDELPQQYFVLGKARDLHAYMSNIEVFGQLYKRGVFTLGKYWSYAIKEGLSPNVYLSQKWVPDPTTKTETKLLLLNTIGYLFSSICGHYSSAIPYFEKALELGGGVPTVKVAEAWYNLSRSYAERSQWVEAFDAVNKAFDIYKKLGLENCEGAGVCYSLAGQYYSVYKHDKEASLDSYSQGLKISRERLGEHDIDTLVAYHNVGLVLCDLRRFDEAKEILEKELRLSLEAFGEESDSTHTAYYGLGHLHFSQKDYAGAIPYFEKSLRIAEAVYGAGSAKCICLYDSLATCFQLQGQWNPAIENWRKSFEANFAAEKIGTDMLEKYLNLATCVQRAGHQQALQDVYDNAREYAQICLDTYPDDLTHATVFFSMGILEENFAFNPKQAREYYKTAISLWEKNGLGEYQRTGVAHTALGRISFNEEAYEKALGHYRKALDIFIACGSPYVDILRQNIQNTEARLR